MTRRQWLAGAAAIGLGAPLGVGLYAWRVEPHWVAFRRRRMPIAQLPPRLAGKRLVQISDLHVGPIVDNAYLRGVLRRVAALRPDYLAITGDLMTCEGPEQLEPTLATLLETLSIEDCHRVVVLGNHDYGMHFRQRRVAEALADRLRDHDYHVLVNSVVTLDELQFAGTADLWSRFCRVPDTLRDLSTDAPAICLSHNPDTVDRPGWEGYRGWILSGHTHGGQCRFPLVGAPVLPIRNARYCEGHVRLSGGRDLYVNRGIGYKRRVRFGVRPEVTEFTLTRA
ncbi:MAG: metallophosphoesterase [Planctomycetota bacterium]